MLAPYFISYGIFTKDRKFCRDYLSHAKINDLPSERNDYKIAHFTDTFNEINGVPNSGNTELVRGKLKENWDFEGFVVS